MDDPCRIRVEVYLPIMEKLICVSGVASVRLTIIDVNDNSPDFPQASYTFSVDEDRPNGDDVGTMTAIDEDSG